MQGQLDALEMALKEKEVLQQFLEKEVAAREEELGQQVTRMTSLEAELDTARQVALDLQQDAEERLNEVLTLKASITAKDYDIGEEPGAGGDEQYLETS